MATRTIPKPDVLWTLTIQPSHLLLADAPGAQPYATFCGSNSRRRFSFMEGMRALAVKTPRNIIFKLPAAAVQAEWLGKPFLAAFT